MKVFNSFEVRFDEEQRPREIFARAHFVQLPLEQDVTLSSCRNLPIQLYSNGFPKYGCQPPGVGFQDLPLRDGRIGQLRVR